MDTRCDQPLLTLHAYVQPYLNIPSGACISSVPISYNGTGIVIQILAENILLEWRGVHMWNAMVQLPLPYH